MKPPLHKSSLHWQYLISLEFEIGCLLHLFWCDSSPMYPHERMIRLSPFTKNMISIIRHTQDSASKITSPVWVIFLQNVDWISTFGWRFESQSTTASTVELSNGSAHLESCKLLQSKQRKPQTSFDAKYKTKRFAIKPFIANACRN